MVLTVEKVLGQYAVIEVDSANLIRKQAEEIAPGHEDLFVDAMGHLIESMIIGHTLFLKQLTPAGLKVYQSLAALQGFGAKGLDEYMRAFNVGWGIHDYFTREKIRPNFDVDILKATYEANADRMPDYVLPLDELTTLLFDDDVLARIPLCRGVYPEEVTDKAVLERIRADENGKSPYTKVSLGTDGSVQSENYGVVYAEDLKNIKWHQLEAAQKLEELTSLTDNEGLRLFVDYLRKEAEANATLEGEYPYTPSDRALIRTYKADHPVTFFSSNSFGSLYPDKFGIKKFLSGELSVRSEDCARLQEIVGGFGDIQRLEDHLPYEAGRRKNVPNVPVIIQDVVFRSGYNFGGAQGIAVSYTPEEKWVVDQEGTVIFCWRNMLDAKSRVIVDPIARTILPEEFIAQYGDDFNDLLSMAFVVGVASHEVGHVLGDQMEGKIISPRLGELYDPINEGDAEAARQYGFDLVVTDGYKGLDRRQLVRFFQHANFADMFRSMRFGKEVPYGHAAMLRLNFFNQAGAVTIDDSLKLQVDYDRLDEAAADLFARHLRILQLGDSDGAKAYDDEFDLEKNPDLYLKAQAILKEIEEKGIPRDITMVYKT